MPGLPLSVHEWRMYELPEVGAHYWHDRTGYRVDRIEQVEEETRVDLIRDPEWEEEMSAGLPDNYLVDGGRDADHGRWHFRVVGPQGRVAGRGALNDNMEAAIRHAVAEAVQHLANRADA